MFLSIIVPVYNALPYIKECLDSILRQTFSDFEVILVDDGSTDGSAKICDEYTDQDSRFRTYHIENGGASRARNVGIADAKGEWISFVDADDTIVDNYIQTFYEIKNKADITYFGVEQSFDDGNKCYRVPYRCYADKRDDIEEVIVNLKYGKIGDVFGWTWSKFYNSKIIQKYNIRFIEGLIFREDEIFTVEYCRYINSIQIIDNILYRYRIHSTGLTAAGLQHRDCILLSDNLKKNLCYYKNEELLYRDKRRIIDYRIKDMWSNYKFGNIYATIIPLYLFLRSNPEYKQYKKDFQIVSILSHSFFISYIMFCLYIALTSIRSSLR
ncbi:MAG: glycosyltransferase [Prevotellaceae bacterium]|nr:glycosyltransferase [Prevotellaceae bacterium]